MKRNYKGFENPENDEALENEEKSDKMIFFEGMSDFFASMLGLLAVFICAMLLYSLVGWLAADIRQMLRGII